MPERPPPQELLTRAKVFVFWNADAKYFPETIPSTNGNYNLRSNSMMGICTLARLKLSSDSTLAMA
jgi:hypothetical protein